jgi:hypothetical protein
VPLGQATEARAAFDADTKPSPLQRAIGAIGDAVSEIRKNGIADWARHGTSMSTESLDQLERSYRQLKQGMYASGLVFNQHQLNVMDRVDAGEKVPEPEDALGYQQMSPQDRADIRARVVAGRVDQLKTIARKRRSSAGSTRTRTPSRRSRPRTTGISGRPGRRSRLTRSAS